MRTHTRAYLTFKSEAERLANFVALVSHAVPVLRQVINAAPGSATVVLKPADNFPHDRSTTTMLLSWAAGYDQELARLIVLATFSYFEAYVRALREVFALQGGADQFLEHATKRATRHWATVSPVVESAKHRLQKPDDKSKIDRAKKFTKVLERERYRFPSDILGVYGARQLLLRVQSDARQEVKASGIPDLLQDALLMKIGASQRRMYDELRLLRNQIAHGAIPTVTIPDAIKRTTALRKFAVRIDEHVVAHFLVLEKYAD